MTSDDSIEMRAAEYALGSLSAGERAEIKARLRGDRELAEAVEQWELRLAPWSHREPGLAPPPQALEGILATIARQSAARPATGTVVPIRAGPSLERRARRWRTAAMALAATTAVLAIALGSMALRPMAPAPGPAMAVLTRGANPAADESAGTAGVAFVATLDARAEALTVRQLAGPRPLGERRYALWHATSDGLRTTFLGLLERGETTTLRLAGRAGIDVRRGTLAVTLESGSPGAAPRGPVVSTGSMEPAAR
jgi:anti-sigma-K factor RskA